MAALKGHQDIDTIDQWYRRIDDITYCYCKEGVYGRFTIPMSEYQDYEHLRQIAPDIPPVPPQVETAPWGGGGVGA